MNKIVLITGATSGIGKACAEKFAEAGYIVIAPDLLTGTAPNGGGTKELGGQDAAVKHVATMIVRATRYPVTGRGGKGYGVLQRGSLSAIVPDEAKPVPSVEEVGE